MMPPCDHCGCPETAHDGRDWDGTECSQCSCCEYVLPSNDPVRAPETWRVIAPDGGVLHVETDGMRAWGAGHPQEYVVSDDGAREAVGMWASHERWSIAEVLAPGELSRAEAIAAAVGAETLRCVAVCDAARAKNGKFWTAAQHTAVAACQWWMRPVAKEPR